MRGKKLNKFTIGMISILAFAVLFSGYLFLLRPILEKDMITVPIESMLTMILALFTIVGIIGVIAMIIMSKGYKNNKSFKKMKKTIILVTSLSLLLLVGQVFYTQKTTYTPPILNEYNDVVPTSITELEEVNSGDIKEWISMRGVDKTKPVLLVLAGDIGESKLSSIRMNLSKLEEEFVVVAVEPLGAGKSFSKLENEEINFEKYISEYQKLLEYVRTRFNKEKIYMLGDSFGSLVGMNLVQRYPQYFAGFIATDFISSFKERSEYCYNRAMEIAEQNSDNEELRKLKAQGKPPYDLDDIYKNEKVYIDYLQKYMVNSPYVQIDDNSKINYILSPEYGMLDRINYFSRKKIYNKIYSDFYKVDLKEMNLNFEVPIYFFEGRNDEVTPAVLAESYFNLINAPYKELVWFEDSGYEPWVTEKDKFAKEVINKLF